MRQDGRVAQSWGSVRFRYILWRIAGFSPRALLRRARAISKQHGRAVLPVLVDMLWSATFKDINFQDYEDWDFAILTKEERLTYITNAISNHVALTRNEKPYQPLFHDKIQFNRRFHELLGRDWLEVEKSSVDEIRAFVERHGRVMGKVPVSTSGKGVTRYAVTEIEDWDAFRARLLERGEILLEQYIENQHPVLAEVCPTTVNTTRVTTYFDGETMTIISIAQKFGRGQASDQQPFGGFFTLIDEQSKSWGPGYGSHQHIYAEHPDSGVSIVDFVMPERDALVAFLEKAVRVVPQIRYVGWDVVLTTDGWIMLEGNWTPGAYENKVSATGIRTGTLPILRAAVGF